MGNGKRKRGAVNDRFTIWVWATKSGEVLFFGNPNLNMPIYHLGGISDLIHHYVLVFEYTKRGLELFKKPVGWNKVQAKYPELKVYPKKITITMSDFKSEVKNEKD